MGGGGGCSIQEGFFEVAVSSIQSFDLLDRRGNIKDDSAEILFQSFLREAFVCSRSFERDVRGRAGMKNKFRFPLDQQLDAEWPSHVSSV